MENFSREKFLKVLEEKGFIKLLPNDQLAMRIKFLDFLKSENHEIPIVLNSTDESRKWAEFKLTYPKKDGNRPLHNNQKECSRKYKEIVAKNPAIHDIIIIAIKAEIKDREQANWKREFRPGWKLMSTYINQEGWTMYENSDEEDINVKEDNYGTKLV